MLPNPPSTQVRVISVRFGCILGFVIMATHTDKLVSEIRALPDEEKFRVLDALLTDLGQPDGEIESVWTHEARKRWEAYKDGRIGSVSYEELMSKYKHK